MRQGAGWGKAQRLGGAVGPGKALGLCVVPSRRLGLRWPPRVDTDTAGGRERQVQTGPGAAPVPVAAPQSRRGTFPAHRLLSPGFPRHLGTWWKLPAESASVRRGAGGPGLAGRRAGRYLVHFNALKLRTSLREGLRARPPHRRGRGTRCGPAVGEGGRGSGAGGPAGAQGSGPVGRGQGGGGPFPRGTTGGSGMEAWPLAAGPRSLTEPGSLPQPPPCNASREIKGVPAPWEPPAPSVPHLATSVQMLPGHRKATSLNHSPRGPSEATATRSPWA